MIGKHFHIYGVQITQKFILQARKSKVDIFTRVPQAKLSQVLLITSKSEEITHSPSQSRVLAKICFPLGRKGEEEETMKVPQNWW